MKVKGLMIVLFNKTIVKLDEYERSVEADIRKLKTRLALVTEARKRKEKKLENIKNLLPERIVFGGKKLYSEKDTVDFPLYGRLLSLEFHRTKKSCKIF